MREETLLEETFGPMPQQLFAATQDGISASEAIAQETPQIGLEQYYSEAGPDYAAWSPEFNMHFGYYRAGANPLNREAMLEQMNAEVLARLQVDRIREPQLLDLGCGLGATLRSFARRLPHSKLSGVTRVPWQVEQARALNASAGYRDRIGVVEADYENTPLASSSFDGVYALESSCYARGSDKRMLLEEAHRLLRPGGRLVVVDGFLSGRFVSNVQQHIYRKVCECWVVEDFAKLQLFERCVEKLGFRDITVEHLQMRVAPSVMHVPWVSLKFLLTDVVFGARAMTRARWNNVLAPLLLPLVSAPLGPLIYCMVGATKI
jgi:cyclopropane fatty-acyl-phospholipid synthase-like methyltransferase